MASATGVGSYRVGVSNLLRELVEAVGEIELSLGVDVEGDEASARALCEEDPAGVYRLMCAVLLCKAKIRMIAVLRANANRNVHSLAVQMRPVLECAGQVVLVFHNLLIEPERGVRVVLNYMNADYYRTMIGLTKGEASHEQLLGRISELNELSQEEVGKGRSLRQSDKVAQLTDGKEWYNFLSERFCHGKADWKGFSWQGGVRSMDTVEDGYTFAGLMDYLVNQVVVMNVYAALSSVGGEMPHPRVEAATAQLREVRSVTAALRDAARLTFSEPSGKGQA